MPSQPIRILLIGAPQTQGPSVRELLDAAGPDRALRTAPSVAAGAETLESGTDVALLDVRGDGTVADIAAIHDIAPVVPVVVLSDDETDAVPAAAMGAQDCLVGPVDLGLLLRTLRYAVDRRPVTGMSETRFVSRLEGLATADPTGAYDTGRLRDAAPDLNEELCDRLVGLLRQRMDDDAYRGTDPAQAGRGAWEFASYLGVLRAHPRDVIDLYLAAVERSTDGHSSAYANHVMASGRYLLVQLLGDLAAYYRTFAWSSRPAPGSARKDR